MSKYLVQITGYHDGDTVTMGPKESPFLFRCKVKNSDEIPDRIFAFLQEKGECFRGTIPAFGPRSGDQAYWVITEPIAKVAKDALEDPKVKSEEHYEELYNNFGGSLPHP